MLPDPFGRLSHARHHCEPLAAGGASIKPVPLLQFKQVNTHYGDLHVLKDVDYTIQAGEIVSLLGGNACGKSTTMKTIMGVVRPGLFNAVCVRGF